MKSVETDIKITADVNKTKDYIKQLVELSGLNQSIYLSGPSGIGKSDIVNQLAQELELELIDLRLGNQDIVSLSGIGVPDLNEKTAFFTRPDFFPPEDCNKKYLLFLDEFNHASKSVFSAAYQLVLERRMNNHILPKDILIIAAGNVISDKGIAFAMPSPLVNRFLHINVVASSSSWLDWAKNENLNWKLQGFIKANPTLLHSFDPKVSEDNFPTPRNWAQTSPYFDIEDEDFRKILLNGKLGQSTMLLVEQHLRMLKNIPNIERILAGESVSSIGDDAGASFSFSVLIKSYLNENLNKLSSDELFNLFKFINVQSNKEVMQYLILELSALLNTKMEDKEELGKLQFKILNSPVQFNSKEFVSNMKDFSKRMN